MSQLEDLMAELQQAVDDMEARRAADTAQADHAYRRDRVGLAAIHLLAAELTQGYALSHDQLPDEYLQRLCKESVRWAEALAAQLDAAGYGRLPPRDRN